ncbi:carboxymuconolactone decarboxylase family protein [Micromonospora hortensis]|uniref:carboxymuconolactone decarboxylase family protein n=1 Tax=Micromonospora hortensis TaxID=2911209 RepID=UPI001EE8FB2C|nr:carboxymuconolactone decarboxylase family protein [Micromonospora hortensis]MCG5451830.1 carboxymuconolactone decarboxylase family protein [Micromonospora hortensis]
MSFLQQADQSLDTERLFEADTKAMGYLPNYTRLFAQSPAVYRAWQQLNGAVKAGMELRRYELATLAAARALKSSYCGLAHGKVLRDKFFDAPTVAAIASDHGSAGLSAQEVAVVAFAGKVAADANSVTEADVVRLRGLGLDDADIFHVILAVGARCFFSTVLSAAGAEPDPQYNESLDVDLRRALSFGG